MRKFMKLTIAILCLAVSALTCFACGETERKEKTVLEPPVIASAVYTGEKQTAVVPENAGYAVTTNDGGVHAGDYDVVLTLTDAEAYEWKTPDEGNAATVTLKFTITKADNEITALTIADRYYGDEASTPVAIAKFGTPAFTYSASENGEYTATVPTAVGKYFVKAAVEGTNDYAGAEKITSFEIKKQNPEFTTLPAAIKNLAYDGAAHALVTAGETAHGTVEYRLGEDDEWSATVPSVTDSGTYSVYYRIKGDDSHSNFEAEAPISVTVAKADVTVTAPTAKTGLEYTGEAQELIAAGTVSVGTMQYKVGESEWSENIPTATNAGTYTVEYKVVVDGNYNEPQGGSVEVVIAKTNATITAPTAKTLTYNGEAQELINAGSVIGGKMQYKVGEGEWSKNIPTATNAGAYTVEYRVVADGNHNAADGGEVKVTIAKADVTVTAPTAKTGLEYTGEAQELIAAGTVSVGTMQYKVGESEWSENIPTATNAGTYTVEYKVVVDDNYVVPQGGSVEVVIAKVNAEVTAPTAKIALKYTGNAQELIAAGTATGGTMQYKVGEGEWSENIPTATNAGTYTVEYKVLPDGNHNAAEGGSVEVKIAKVDMVITHPTGIEGLVYTGEALVVVNKGSIIGGKIEFFNNANDTWSENPPTKTNAGNYQYRYRVVADNNHNEITEEYRVSFKIAKMANSVKFDTASMDVTYPAVPAPKATAIFGEITYTYATVANKDNAEAYGDWNTIVSAGAGKQYYCKATAAGDNNHENAAEIRLFTVHKGANAFSEFELTAATLKCGNEIGYTAKANGGTVVVKYSVGENGQYYSWSELLKKMIELDANNAIGNGFTYWARAFVENDDFYTDATADARSFVLNHDFIDGVCKGCNYAQTGIAYGETETEAYVTGYDGNHSKEVYILAEYNGKPVTYIAHQAFRDKTIKKIVMPTGITDLGGLVFQDCRELEYVDMRGIDKLLYNKDGRPDGQNGCDNNFLNCIKLTTVIVKNGYTSEGCGAQFSVNGEITNPEKVVNLYAYGTATVSAHANDKLFTGTIYYLGDGEKCFTWKFDDSGVIKTGPVKHDFVDGKCATCGLYMVEYAYDSASTSYYVKGFAAGVNEENVVIVEKYNDGTNGEHPVTYVAAEAFANNQTIKKVIMPGITDIGGRSFDNCAALEYVDMRGVTYIPYAKSEPARPDNANDANNNFINCVRLTTVIVGNGYHAAAQQFVLNGKEKINEAVLYVNGTGLAQLDNGDSLMSGTIYYLGDGVKCLTWKFDENGEFKAGPKHNFVNGVCENCQEKDAMGVTYAYDSASDTYFVAGYTGDSETVNVFGTWNDGTHDEKAVTFVRANAFESNSIIKKVILPASVTDLDGYVFLNCPNLEYVSMVGVKNLVKTTQGDLKNAGKRSTATYPQNEFTHMNFQGCAKLTTIVVGKEFVVGENMFNGATAYVNVYTLATGETDGTVTLNKGTQNGMLNNIYYYSGTEAEGFWHYVDGVATLWETAQA